MTRTAPSNRRRWIALVVLCLGQLMIVLDATIVNVALPSIQSDLDFTQASLTWVVNAYLIAFGSFLLLAGRLGDLIGRKKVFIGGLTLFTFASVLCGLADDQTLLIAARFIQGVGGAVASSVIIAIIVTEFRQPREQAKAMGVFAFVASAGGSIGLLAGGVLTHALNWHWIFFINLPIGLVAIGLGLVLVEENEGAGLRQGVDILGSVLITAAMMLGVYTIVKTGDYGWRSARTLGPRRPGPGDDRRLRRLRVADREPDRAAAGAALAQPHRGEHRPRPARNRHVLLLLPRRPYLEHVLDYSAVQTGLAFLPMTLSIGALSVAVTPRLLHRFGAKQTLIPGLVLTLEGLILFARIPVDATYWPDLFPAFLLLGLGAGTSFMPLITLAMSEVPKADAGLGSGLINVSQQMSGAIGVAVLGTLAASRTSDLAAEGHSQASALTSGFHFSFTIASCCVALGIVLAAAILRPVEALGPSEPTTEELRIREGLLADEMV